MARGSARARKIKAWTTKANHGQKPAKGRPTRMLTYRQILALRKSKK